MTPIIKPKITPHLSNIQPTSTQSTKRPPQGDFASHLEKALGEEVRFSKHALQRIQSRELTPSDTQIKRLNEGVMLAKEKGSQNTLVLVDDLAFVVSVKNNTVVTALSGRETARKVFTQIDSTVIN